MKLADLEFGVYKEIEPQIVEVVGRPPFLEGSYLAPQEFN
jgi:hypothetical protein